MKNEYLKALDIIVQAKGDLQKLLRDVAGNKTMEDQEAYSSLDNIVSKLEGTESDLRYLNKPVKEGILKEDSDSERYYIIFDDDGYSSCNLTCGSTLEVCMDNEWVLGAS